MHGIIYEPAVECKVHCFGDESGSNAPPSENIHVPPVFTKLLQSAAAKPDSLFCKAEYRALTLIEVG